MFEMMSTEKFQEYNEIYMYMYACILKHTVVRNCGLLISLTVKFLKIRPSFNCKVGQNQDNFIIEFRR